MFAPTHTFISTGDKVAMYTLREAGIYTEGDNMMYVDYFIQNLSNDRDKAIEKAKVISTEIGLTFRTDGELFGLNEIKRMRTEERIRIEMIKEEEQNRKDKEVRESFDAEVSDGNFILGKYVGESPSDVATNHEDIAYIKWFAAQYVEGEVSRFNINAAIAKKWIDANPQPESSALGEVHENLTVTGKVIVSMNTESFYGITRMVVIKDDECNVVKMYSTAKKINDLRVGDTITVTGKVKSHTTYRGEKQTNIGGRLKVEKVA